MATASPGAKDKLKKTCRKLIELLKEMVDNEKFCQKIEIREYLQLDAAGQQNNDSPL